MAALAQGGCYEEHVRRYGGHPPDYGGGVHDARSDQTFWGGGPEEGLLRLSCCRPQPPRSTLRRARALALSRSKARPTVDAQSPATVKRRRGCSRLIPDVHNSTSPPSPTTISGPLLHHLSIISPSSPSTLIFSQYSLLRGRERRSLLFSPSGCLQMTAPA